MAVSRGVTGILTSNSGLKWRRFSWDYRLKYANEKNTMIELTETDISQTLKLRKKNFDWKFAIWSIAAENITSKIMARNERLLEIRNKILNFVKQLSFIDRYFRRWYEDSCVQKSKSYFE